MGRRSRNKQSDPPSLEHFNDSKSLEHKRKLSKKQKQKKLEKKINNLDDEHQLKKTNEKRLFDSSDEEPIKQKKKTLGKSKHNSTNSYLLEKINDDSSEEFYDAKNDCDNVFSDSENNDEIEKLNIYNIEKLSEKLDQKNQTVIQESQKELHEQNDISGPKLNFTDNDSTDPGFKDVTLVKTEIFEILRVLENFTKLKEEGKSRNDYIEKLLKNICEFYGYSEFMAEKLFKLFSPTEAIEFFESNEIQRPVTIRTNTLKTTSRNLISSLQNRGMNLKLLGLCFKDGIQVFESQVPVGATPEYLSGYYMLQSASSFIPVIALDPQMDERILDMSAAPGGKTTHISALMKNSGCIFANDVNKDRIKSLIANIHRMGCTNTIVSNHNALEFPKILGAFDRVLLDAPCSGTGIISKDNSVKVSKTQKDFVKISFLQKQLLLAAIDSTNEKSSKGGIIVYSTCSVTVEENEEIVDYALRKRPNVKLVEIGVQIGKQGFTSYSGKHFDPSLKLTKRYYPHNYNVDGFFVAKFKKFKSLSLSTNNETLYGEFENFKNIT